MPTLIFPDMDVAKTPVAVFEKIRLTQRGILVQGGNYKQVSLFDEEMRQARWVVPEVISDLDCYLRQHRPDIKINFERDLEKSAWRLFLLSKESVEDLKDQINECIRKVQSKWPIRKVKFIVAPLILVSTD